MIIYISESGRANKKWKAETEGHRAVHFGQRGADDFTIHRDEAARQAYIARHGSKENWGRTGVMRPPAGCPAIPLGEAQPPCRHRRGVAYVPGRDLPTRLESSPDRVFFFVPPVKRQE